MHVLWAIRPRLSRLPSSPFFSFVLSHAASTLHLAAVALLGVWSVLFAYPNPVTRPRWPHRWRSLPFPSFLFPPAGRR